ncbi:MAG: hypothetical protein LBH74_09925 [Nitrososphaerota archaeon]|jgi:hypothetical protein|nr:hypothetical protein [Nitrososphaerota archaeon]
MAYMRIFTDKVTAKERKEALDREARFEDRERQIELNCYNMNHLSIDELRLIKRLGDRPLDRAGFYHCDLANPKVVFWSLKDKGIIETFPSKNSKYAYRLDLTNDGYDMFTTLDSLHTFDSLPPLRFKYKKRPYVPRPRKQRMKRPYNTNLYDDGCSGDSYSI